MTLNRIIVIDEFASGLRYLTSTLETIPRTLPEGFSSLPDALAWAEDNAVDAFVVSDTMEHPSDRGIIERIRAIPRFATTPLVVLVGAHQGDRRIECYLSGANDFIVRPIDRAELLARVGRLIALHEAERDANARAAALEHALDVQERRLHEHTKRIETLWHLANTFGAPQSDLLMAMLDEGTGAIRPGMAYYGQIARLEGEELVIVAASTQESTLTGTLLEAITTGNRFPISGTAQASVLRFGMTRTWDDLFDDPTIDSVRQRTLAWRSAISTPFQSIGTSYFLTFLSREPNDERFSPDDVAYVELLATFFSTHFQQQWQRSRLVFQNSHDVLTGLLNSVYFRSEVRMAMFECSRFAMLVVNLIAFARVNETVGFQTGDALIVEVAAVLQRLAKPTEIVGRLAGDAFAIFVPESADVTLDERIGAYRAAFPSAFSTGDRAGSEFVTLDARIGVAYAPHDGSTYDAVLSAANARVSAQKNALL